MILQSLCPTYRRALICLLAQPLSQTFSQLVEFWGAICKRVYAPTSSTLASLSGVSMARKLSVLPAVYAVSRGAL
jgi:hypothetical protein